MTAPNAHGAIRIDDLTVAYDRVPAVHHVSGVFAAGSLTAIVGHNGAGKSTLLKAIVGLQRPDSGHIRLEGITRDDIGYLPQRARVDQSFPVSVRDVASLGLWRRTGMLGGVTAEGEAQIGAALTALELDGLDDRPIGTLSTGQIQRVLFARLMLQQASVILLDEPFDGLDAQTTEHLLATLKEWHAEGRTVIAVLHDLALVRRAFPRALLMSKGNAQWGATAQVLGKAQPQNLAEQHP
jgi:zinc/manganese transport system ATP-binding protein